MTTSSRSVLAGLLAAVTLLPLSAATPAAAATPAPAAARHDNPTAPGNGPFAPDTPAYKCSNINIEDGSDGPPASTFAATGHGRCALHEGPRGPAVSGHYQGAVTSGDIHGSFYLLEGGDGASTFLQCYPRTPEATAFSGTANTPRRVHGVLCEYAD